MKLTQIEPQKHIFEFGLTDGECHEKLTGVCSLEKPFGRKNPQGENDLTYCQKLYKSLLKG